MVRRQRCQRESDHQELDQAALEASGVDGVVAGEGVHLQDVLRVEVDERA